MYSSAVLALLLALLHATSATPSTPPPTSTPHRLHKRLETGSKIAIGICIPCVALVLGLGIGIMWFYPEQRRKLRAQNARREWHLANQADGRLGQRQGSEHATLPVYKEHEGGEYELESVAQDDAQAPLPPPPALVAAPGQLGRRYEAPPSTDARHAALVV